jgi:hypothetical protein
MSFLVRINVKHIVISYHIISYRIVSYHIYILSCRILCTVTIYACYTALRTVQSRLYLGSLPSSVIKLPDRAFMRRNNSWASSWVGIVISSFAGACACPCPCACPCTSRLDKARHRPPPWRRNSDRDIILESMID